MFFFSCEHHAPAIHLPLGTHG